MPAALSKNENRVIERLKKVQVADLEGLQKNTQLSRSTILRAVGKFGYYSSYNFNSRYLTLKGTPKFDRQGLWCFTEIRFSRNHTLEKTLEVLINSSTDGFAVQELEDLLGVRVHNQLSRLLRGELIDSFYLGRNAVYLCSSTARAEQQRRRRLKQTSGQRALGLNNAAQVRIPAGLDALTVIAVLIQCIEAPKSDPVAIYRHLQPQHPSLSAKQVERIFGFYGLKKKRAR